MALPKEWPPKEIKISFKDWQEMSDTLLTIRSFSGVDDQYNDIKCPECGLHMWVPDEENTKINCLACHHEYQLCRCGEVLTEEKRSQNDTAICISCWESYCKANRMCPGCGKDLVDDPHNKGYMHCEDGCIDPVKY